MSELGKARLRTRLWRYRYMHCRNRARTRYDLELSEDQYRTLCEAFKTPNPDIWKTDSGDLEGWLYVGHKPILCHYSPKEDLIVTLLEPPSEIANQEPISSQNSSLALELAQVRKELRDLRNYRIKDSDYNVDLRIGDYVLFLKNKLQESSVAQDVGVWYKAQIQKALKAWKAGDMDLARALLLCLANSPASFDPLKDPRSASDLLDSMAQAKIEYWKLSGGN